MEQFNNYQRPLNLVRAYCYADALNFARAEGLTSFRYIHSHESVRGLQGPLRDSASNIKLFSVSEWWLHKEAKSINDLLALVGFEV